MVRKRGGIEMSEIDDLKEQYKPLSEVKVPEHIQERIYNMIDNYNNQVATIQPKRKISMTWMRSAVAVVACLVVAGGVYTYSNHNTSTPNQGIQVGQNKPGQLAGTSWGIPANVAWNGYYYETKGYVQTVGSNLGVATYPGPAKIFSIPGQNPDQKIALQVDTPNGKYVSAARVPIDTKTSPIPGNWMTINTPKLETTIQSGEKITLSGSVFFRELYGTTVEVGIKKQGADYPQILSTQEFRVSNNGTITGTFNVPKELSGQPNKTQYLLVFRGISKQHPTNMYYFPMMLK